MNDLIIALDIGNHTALAMFKDGELASTDIIHLDAHTSIESRIAIACDWLESHIEYVGTRRNIKVLIEGVQIYSSSSKSLASAFSGDAIWLAYLAGALLTTARNAMCDAKIVLPREWKGSMGKDIVKARIKRALGFAPQEHIADAIGIGLSHMGRL